MASHERWTRFTNGLMIVCALAATGILVRREFFAGPDGPMIQDTEPKLIEGWQKYAEVGHWIGPSTPSVLILEFSDFECPACGRFERSVLPGVVAKYPNDVAVVFRHWPLSYHRFAYPAGRAAECAAGQGRFAEFKRQLFEYQDSLGLKTFVDFARESDVPDLAAFEECSKRSEVVPAIEADTKIALDLKFPGTPVVIVNGMHYPGAVVQDSVAFDKIVAEAVRAVKGSGAPAPVVRR